MNRIAKTGTAVIAGALIALAAPLAASAHVTIDTKQAAPGSYPTIQVQVPNESATEATNRVELTLPTDEPFGYVGYVPVAGWSTEVVKDGETPVAVVWTADAGSEITDGQVQRFPIVLGPIPDTGSIVLATDQTYTDGSVVSWSGTEEGAEHPAPVLYVNDTPPADEHGGTHDDGDDDGHDDTVTAEPISSVTESSTDVLARILGIGGLVVGIVGLVFAITTRRTAAK